MTDVLILMTLPEAVRNRYRDHLRATFPALAVNVADHHTRVGPHIRDTEILLTYGSMIEDHVLRDAPRLKWIHALTTGTDGIDNLPSLRPEVLLTSTRGIHGASMSEAALLAMLAFSRDFVTSLRHQDRRVWQRRTARLLEGRTVGIFGLGVIGRALAPRCKALGMRVVGVDPLLPETPGVDVLVSWKDVTPLIGDLDFVVLLIPSTPATRGLFDAGVFSRMRKTSFLVNLSRGDVIDDDALAAALRGGQIAGAALDVFRKEPLPADHPFWSLENVIITPHLGGAFDEYPQRALPIIEENFRRYLAGDTGNMINIVRH